MNFLDGQLETGGGPKVVIGGVTVPVDRYKFDGSGTPPAGPAVLGIRPEHILFGNPAAAMPFTQEVDVEIVEPMGSDTLVWAKLGGRNLAFRVESEKALNPGDRVRIGFDPARASLFDSATGNRI
jgi:multiple sugar transport system ATP-binding protein